MHPIKKGQTFEASVTDLAFGARGISKIDDFVWFIDRAIPGQKVLAKAYKKRKSYGEAYKVEVLEKSPFEVTAPCPWFGWCGGCQLQNLNYEKQCEYKSNQIRDIFTRPGLIEPAKVHPVLPAAIQYGYRNKMEFTFGTRPWSVEGPEDTDADFALGLHIPRKFNRVLDMTSCVIQSDHANALLEFINNLTRKSGLPAFDIKTHLGYWRFCIIREGHQTGQSMLQLITTSQFDNGNAVVDDIIKKVQDQHEITTIIHSIADGKGQVARGDSHRILTGNGTIIEKISENEFEIAPDAFFQTNTRQAELLFDTIQEAANLKGNELLYDLYCGTGAIGIHLAKSVRQVIGVEVIEPSIINARANAARNNIENIEFILADMKNALRHQNLTEKYGPPDVVIIDPPRGGTHPKTIDDLLALKSSKLIYVSCNPPMAAKDLQKLSEIYEITSIQPVDMFPHTKHIEAVIAMTLKNEIPCFSNDTFLT